MGDDDILEKWMTEEVFEAQDYVGKWYAACPVRIEDVKLQVHFLGWEVRWDEKFTALDCMNKLRPLTSNPELGPRGPEDVLLGYENVLDKEFRDKHKDFFNKIGDRFHDDERSESDVDSVDGDIWNYGKLQRREAHGNERRASNSSSSSVSSLQSSIDDLERQAAKLFGSDSSDEEDEREREGEEEEGEEEDEEEEEEEQEEEEEAEDEEDEDDEEDPDRAARFAYTCDVKALLDAILLEGRFEACDSTRHWYSSYAVGVTDDHIKVHFEGWNGMEESLAINVLSSRVRMLSANPQYGPQGREDVVLSEVSPPHAKRLKEEEERVKKRFAEAPPKYFDLDMHLRKKKFKADLC
mmetsp:Transcript_40673/g.105581  ORF Transcript_40673/g.105581 Transcript_40673/m.105581 type:complete len:353 (-) Transcript_40673:224-1282(-)